MRDNFAGARAVNTSWWRRWLWVWMIPLVLLVCWLGARRLSFDLFWVDEYASLYYAAGVDGSIHSFADVLRATFDPSPNIMRDMTRERHLPGYYLLLNLWMQVVGSSEFTGRTLSLLIGLLALGCMYGLARSVTGSPVAGVSASVFMGVTAFYVHHLHEMRMYLLIVLIMIGILWLYWRLCQPERWSWGFALMLLVSINIGTYVYSPMPLVLAGLGIYHLFLAARHASWRWMLLILVVAAVLIALWYFPWLGVRWEDMSTQRERIIATPSAAELLGMLVFQFSNGAPILLLTLAAVGLISLRTRTAVWAGFLLAFGVGITLLASYFFPIYNVRNFAPVLPMFALLIGIGIDSGARRGIHPAPVLLLWIALGVWNNLQDLSENRLIERQAPAIAEFAQVTDFLNRCHQDTDKVIYKLQYLRWNAWWTEIVDYYLRDARFSYVNAIWPKEHDQATLEQAFFLMGAERLWVVKANYLYDSTEMWSYEIGMMRDYRRCEAALRLNDLTVNLYGRLSADGESSTCPPSNLTVLNPSTCAADAPKESELEMS